jgi:lactoylglutathione lyase
MGFHMAVLNMNSPLELGFCVADLDASLAFWRDGIGLTFVSDISTDERAAVESGFAHCGYRVIRLQLPTGERIKLFAPATKMTSGHERRRPLEQVGLAFLTLIVKDLAGTLALLAPKGIVPRSPPYELRAGVFVALVDDPDGNVVELVQYADIKTYRRDTHLTSVTEAI